MAQAESTRLRELVKDRGKKINELESELDKANSTIDQYRPKVAELTTRHETAASLIRDQKNTIDDLNSKLHRADEENKNLISRIDIMSKQGLGEGMTTEKEDDINTLSSLNERLIYQLGQAKEVNEDCETEIEDLKSSNEERIRIQRKSDTEIDKLKEQTKVLQSKLDDSEKIRNEQSNLIRVSSTEVNTNTKSEELIMREKNKEIKDLKERNSTLENDVERLTSRLTTMTAMHTERSRNEMQARTKIIEINNQFTVRELKLVKQVVNKVYEFKDALGESAIIAESILIHDSKALEHEKLYTVSKRPEDLRNQRLYESEVNENQKKLTLVYDKITLIDRELRETGNEINLTNETYREDINAVYKVMHEQQLINEALVLTPIERLVITSPVSFKSNLSKANIVKSYTETKELLANITRSQRVNSTESSPASSPMSSHTSSPSSSPRGEKPMLSSKSKIELSKGDSAVIKETMLFLKPRVESPSIDTKPVVKLKPMSKTANKELTPSSMREMSKTKVTIPSHNVSQLSKAFQPSTDTYIENPTPNKEEKNTTHTTQNELD